MPPKGLPSSSIAAAVDRLSPWTEHRHHSGDQDPLPAPLSGGIVAGGGAGFVDVDHRLLTGKGQGLLHGQRQGCAQALADRGNLPAAHGNSQQLLEQRLGLAETQWEDIAQQAHQGTEPRTIMTGLHSCRQRGAGAGGAAGGGTSGAQIPLKSWDATLSSSRRGFPYHRSKSSTGRKPSVKTPWRKCVGLMAFVAHAAKALLMDSFTDAGSGGISVGNAATKLQ